MHKLRIRTNLCIYSRPSLPANYDACPLRVAVSAAALQTIRIHISASDHSGMNLVPRYHPCRYIVGKQVLTIHKDLLNVVRALINHKFWRQNHHMQ